jgi:hypothetical protein
MITETTDVATAVEAGQEAFWQEVIQRFPEARSGDLPPDVLIAFDLACTRAVTIRTHCSCEPKPACMGTESESFTPKTRDWDAQSSRSYPQRTQGRVSSATC